LVGQAETVEVWVDGQMEYACQVWELEVMVV
jgi:hypothetical protein